MKFLLLALVALPLQAAPLPLVRGGQPQAVIVVPDADAAGARRPATQLTNEAFSVALAAVELADYVEKISGARLPICAESALPESPKGRIFVGDCRATQALLAGRFPAPEEFVIRTAGSALHIVGGDLTPEGLRTLGTLYGVYDLLEHELGVRWLFPGELGEVVPRRATIELPALDGREQPRLAKRKIRNVAVSREALFAPLLAEWGIPVEAWKAAHGTEATGAWFRRQRLGARLEINGGHSYAGYYEKYGREHPEFFALQPNGTRRQQPDRERLCKANPELWDFIAQRRIEELKANPAMRTISIAPNDGGANKFCMCERCRALDPPNAPKLLNDPSLIDPATGRPFVEYPSLSDRVFRFFNEIARRVRRELPDRQLVCYAYSVYRTPPVALGPLEPNLLVGYVGLERASIEAWSKIAPELIIRPNDLGPAVELGLPRNYAPWLADSVKFAAGHRAIAFDFDNCHGNWGGHGLDYYVLARALWNPELNPAEVIADYCRAAYGAGAPAMERYFARLEKISDGVRQDEKLGPRGGQVARLGVHYSPEALAGLGADLRAARDAIGADPGPRARVALAEDSLEYARRVTALLAAAPGPAARPTAEYQQRLTAVVELVKGKVLTPSIASLHSFRYLRTALALAEREVE